MKHFFIVFLIVVFGLVFYRFIFSDLTSDSGDYEDSPSIDIPFDCIPADDALDETLAGYADDTKTKHQKNKAVQDLKNCLLDSGIKRMDANDYIAMKIDSY